MKIVIFQPPSVPASTALRDSDKLLISPPMRLSSSCFPEQFWLEAGIIPIAQGSLKPVQVYRICYTQTLVLCYKSVLCWPPSFMICSLLMCGALTPIMGLLPSHFWIYTHTHILPHSLIHKPICKNHASISGFILNSHLTHSLTL